MATRDALIEAGTQAVCDWDPDYDPADADTRAAVGVVIDAVESEIRADEQERFARWKAEATEVMLGWERVWEALGSPGTLGESKAAAVLALLNEGQPNG